MNKGHKRYHLGIDIGSVSVNVVLVDETGKVVEEQNRRLLGEPLQIVLEILTEVLEKHKRKNVGPVAVTGSGGKLVAELLGGTFINEVIAQSTATAHQHPEVRTIIEIGGEDAKLILMELDPTGSGEYRIEDFSMNSVCSAGTGSFLDQQAFRLQIDIEEFGKLALKSKTPPRIAGRCSVFAKSDMIHLQQVGTPHYDIVAGLCYALARNFISVLGAGKKMTPPIAFQGGVAANAGIRRAFKELLRLNDEDLIIPKRFMSMGAIGAVLHTMKDGKVREGFKGLEALEKHLKRLEREGEVTHRLPLEPPKDIRSEELRNDLGSLDGKKIKAYLGIDVGSVSTNLVLIDEHKKVIAKRYLRTQSKPLQVVQQGLRELAEEVGDKVEIAGVGTTGSGRYLTGDFVGADVIRNEISAQAAASIDIDPEVDTIFEIGGQDSKYISVDHGVVVDFNMNHACAAGTGSFLEEQAEQLGVDIKGEFSDLAFSSKNPVPLAEKCTVFMESDLVHYQQKGSVKEDLMAGLSYSIVQNYINKVVKTGAIGNRIFFQGGTAFNKAVVSAFEQVTGKRIIVPPHHEVTGAIGVALLAQEAANGEESTFKGFDLSEKTYKFMSFQCQECPNICEINKITIEGSKPLFYGSRCGKFDVDKEKKKDFGLPDLFEEREQWMLNLYPTREPADPGAPAVGIPRSLMMWELFPLFKAFFSELGFRIILSDKTNETIAKKSTEVVSGEFCFPVKIAHGHVLNLVEKGVDYIFLPAIQEMKKTDKTQEHAWLCPWNQCIPFTILSAMDLTKYGVKVLHPDIWFSAPEPLVMKKFGEIGKEVGRSWMESLRAYYVAKAHQEKFHELCVNRGKEVLENLADDDMAIVILSRSYNGCDQRLNLNIPKKLRKMGVLPIPMDFLPLDDMELRKEDERINWKNGQRFVKAARFIAKDPRLYAMYITNFNCGPDAFIRYYITDNLKGTPCFELEVDEHSSDTGAITRCEAYLDSLNNRRNKKIQVEVPEREYRPYTNDMTIYMPQPDCLNSLPSIFQATYKAFGLDIKLCPKSNHETLEYSRQFSTSKECYPYQLVLGDLVKVLKDDSIDKNKLAFMTPVTPGACRLLGYPKGFRSVLDRLGYSHVPTINPTTRWKEGKALIGGKNHAQVEILAYLANTVNELLLKRLREVRPYEVNKGEADALYEALFKELLERTAKKKRFEPLLKKASRQFAGIKTEGVGTKPVVALLGEIYVRMTPFANANLEEEIERLGGEAWVVPLSELMFFRNRWFVDYSLMKLKPAEAASWAVTDLGMKFFLHRYERHFKDTMKNPFDSVRAEETQDRASPFVYKGMWGETVPNIGRMVELIEHNLVHGIVNVGPFACMPTTLADALSKAVLQKMGTFPFMTMSCEGLEKTNALTRIEAFMYQAQQFMREKERGQSEIQDAL